MGSFGISGGNIRAQNLQGDVVTVAVDGSGNGSSTVSFRQSMKGTSYAVNVTPNQSGTEIWTTGVTTVGSKTTSGCKIYVRGCSTTSSSIKVGYVAFDDNYR